MAVRVVVLGVVVTVELVLYVFVARLETAVVAWSELLAPQCPLHKSSSQHFRKHDLEAEKNISDNIPYFHTF